MHFIVCTSHRQHCTALHRTLCNTTGCCRTGKQALKSPSLDTGRIVLGCASYLFFAAAEHYLQRHQTQIAILHCALFNRQAGLCGKSCATQPTGLFASAELSAQAAANSIANLRVITLKCDVRSMQQFLIY